MRHTVLFATIAIALGTVSAPSALAHEHYMSEDGQYSLVLGEQNEPVYTYDWTNLDFIVHEDETNGTGGPVPGVHETVNATLISPGGEELSLPIEPQFGEKGRYAFVQDYFLTQPGQYEVRLTGHINGSDVNGTYKLPGPRPSMAEQGFPTSPVPTLLDLNQRVSEVQDLREENAQLRQEVDELSSRVDSLRSELDDLQSRADGMSAGAGDGPTQQNAPTLGAIVATSLIALVALAYVRRRR